MIGRARQITKYFALILIAIQGLSLSAKDPQKTPIFTEYGPVYEIKNRDVKLRDDFTYKAVFDVANTANSPEDYSRRLESVARFINMHALNGVPLEKMQLAVVMHSKASKDAMSNAAYQKKYQLDNPNIALIEQLASKGVKFYICGQSASFMGIEKEHLIKPVKLALSAMTQLVVLQSEGYALLP